MAPLMILSTGSVNVKVTVPMRAFLHRPKGPSAQVRDLFDAAERLDIEGIVAKRKADLYRPETVWYKIKSRTYTQEEVRWELFQKRPP
jgi:hypothetical protein